MKKKMTPQERRQALLWRHRRMVLTEWRGFPPKRKERLTSVGDVLEKLVPRLGLGERLDEQQIQNAWRSLVGDFLAEHSRPASLRNKVLVIQVLQPSVHYELDRVWRGKILDRLQERFGRAKIRDIRFRV
ncbi:MAG: DUF721 domain-containing protein [Chthoniobacterales bacterium]